MTRKEFIIIANEIAKEEDKTCRTKMFEMFIKVAKDLNPMFKKDKFVNEFQAALNRRF